jgi:hypothetical protein
MPHSHQQQSPPYHLPDRSLILTLVVATIIIIGFFLIKPMLSATWQMPGSALLQSGALIAVLLLLVPVGFSLNKRTGAGGASTRWFSMHVIATIAGTVLAVIHGSARFDAAPALLLLAIAGLIITGATARVYLSSNMAATFGTKRHAFKSPDADQRQQLQVLIERKRVLLHDLDPTANEAIFSVTLGHFLRSPCQTYAYQRLQRQESILIGARQSVGALQAWWRPLHIILGYGLIIGLIIHVITVTFFAGYVAEGRDIYWWHLTAW